MTARKAYIANWQEKARGGRCEYHYIGQHVVSHLILHLTPSCPCFKWNKATFPELLSRHRPPARRRETSSLSSSILLDARQMARSRIEAESLGTTAAALAKTHIGQPPHLLPFQSKSVRGSLPFPIQVSANRSDLLPDLKKFTDIAFLDEEIPIPPVEKLSESNLQQ